MYNVLKEIFDEYQDIFDYDSFHVGGDEVSVFFYFTRHPNESYLGFYNNVKGLNIIHFIVGQPSMLGKKWNS